MAKAQIPGMAVAVVNKDGSCVYKGAFGVKRVGHDDEAVGLETHFMIGSATKPFTGILAANRIERGAFIWTTPVHSLLEACALSTPELTQQFTLEQALSASAGLTRFDWKMLLNEAPPEVNIATMSRLKRETAPMAKFGYSNLAAMAGGYAAAAVSPKQTTGLYEAYTDAMEREVFGPLGMTETFFGVQKANGMDSASPHNLVVTVTERGGLAERRIETWTDSVAPAGGAWSTIDDICKYLLMELNNGVIPSGTRFMSEAMIADRRRPRVPVDPIPIGPATLFPCSEYGICLFKNTCPDNGLVYYHHGGNTLGFSSNMAFFPEQGFGLVILTNMAFSMFFTEAITAKIIQMMIPGIAGFDPEGHLESAKIFNDSQMAIARSIAYDRVDAIFEPFFQQRAVTLLNEDLGKIHIQRDDNGVWFKIGPNRMRVAELKPKEGEEPEKGTYSVVALYPWMQFNGCQITANSNNLSMTILYEQKPYKFTAN